MPELTQDTQLNSLDRWLLTATRGLCDEARERIEAEVRRHVDEAIADLKTSDLSADAANAETIRQLGDPKAAGRAFRRSNLTASEVNSIRFYRDFFPVIPLDTEGKRTFFRIINYISIAWIVAMVSIALMVMALGRYGEKIPDGGAAVFLLISAPSIYFVLPTWFVQWAKPRDLRRTAVGFHFLVLFCGASALVLYHFLKHSYFNDIWSNSCAYGISALILAQLGNLWLKLRRIERRARAGI